MAQINRWERTTFSVNIRECIMKTSKKDKLQHDFLNSIVIINSMTKSASSFLNKLSKSLDSSDISQKQMEKFLCSMNIIREQTARIEIYFQTIMNE